MFRFTKEASRATLGADKYPLERARSAWIALREIIFFENSTFLAFSIIIYLLVLNIWEIALLFFSPLPVSSRQLPIRT